MNLIKKGLWLSIAFFMASLVMVPAFAYTCGLVTTNSGRLNIRQQPTTWAKLKSKAVKASALRILKSSGKWYKVKLNNGRVGYGLKDYIEKRYNGSCAIVVTKRTPLNIRRRATRGSRVIGQAAKGSAVTIWEWGRYWAQVMLNDGTMGFANRRYLNIIE
jgi:uncharacterized protein YgiM (DUF1202 family)